LATPARTTPNPEELSCKPDVAAALTWLRSHEDWITEQQIRLTEIAAPPFGEALRAKVFRDLLAGAGWEPEIDKTGNLIAESRGTSRRVVLISAHLDTALALDGPIRVVREGTRMVAPGIADNGAGLAALVGVASAFRAAGLKTRQTVVFAANVGEEGEGNLRGMRALVDRYRRRLEAAIAIDGASIRRITTIAVGSRRLEILVRGPGGHSWGNSDVPNPIQALGRAMARIAAIPIPRKPKTTLNIGTIAGGEAVNAVPSGASMKIDLRSESDEELYRLEREVRRAVEQGALDEREARRRDGPSLTVEFKPLGLRPGGRLATNSPLLQAIREVDRFLGIGSETDAGSTDANIPLSLGIPAIAIGGGGTGDGAHTAEEWYDARGRITGLERILLTLLLVAGPVA
jgi:tripeptide aminopeptidase